MQQMRDPAGSLFSPGGFGSRLVLARVDSIDTLKDDTGSEKLDDNGNAISTGLLNVTLLERGGSRSKVPYVMAAGNTMFAGGIPELGQLCVLGFRQENDPIIIGFLPPSIHGLVSERQTLPNLISGEVLFQGTSQDTDINGNLNFFRNARVWLDRYGRVRIEAQDYEFITGYLLSNEFTANVSRLVDPVTNNPIFMRERIGIGVERRVDDQGNAVSAFNKDVYTSVEGNKTTTTGGVDTRTAQTGYTYTDGRGTGIAVTVDGQLQLTAQAGTYSLSVLGNSREEHGACKTVMIGVDLVEVVMGDESRLVGGGRSTIVATKNSEERVLLGKKLLSSLQAMILMAGGEAPPLEALITALPILYLGNPLELFPIINGVVTGMDVDTLTGCPQWMMGSGSSQVVAGK